MTPLFAAFHGRVYPIREANSVDAKVTKSEPLHVSRKPVGPTSLPDPGNLREVLAYWVRLKRVALGWSQERLAHECELDRTYVSAVERGRWNVSLSNIELLAKALNSLPWQLLKPPQAEDLDSAGMDASEVAAPKD